MTEMVNVVSKTIQSEPECSSGLLCLFLPLPFNSPFLLPTNTHTGHFAMQK